MISCFICRICCTPELKCQQADIYVKRFCDLHIHDLKFFDVQSDVLLTYTPLITRPRKYLIRYLQSVV